MKTLKQVKKEIGKHGDVMTAEEYREWSHCMTPWDGIGYYHDGENRTDISVFESITQEQAEKLPYVIWYNK